LLERLERRLPVLTGGARDLPARQRTMHDAIGWSYELLGPAHQAAFRQLSVCVGGCTLEAAEVLLELSSTDVLDIVGVLVDHSLVRVWEDSSAELRLTMLEVIREYGLAQLATSPDAAAARARHARFFLQLAEAAGPHIMGTVQQGQWLQRLERERGNLVAALQWASECGDDELGLRLVSALGPFWYFRGYFSEGRRWIDHFLASTAHAEDAKPFRGLLLYGAAKLALEQGDHARVHAVAAEAETLASALGDARGMSQALEMQGVVARLRGDPLGGRALLEQALVWGRQAGDRGQLERVLFGLGHASREVGDLSRAELVFQELLVDSRKSGPSHGEARVLMGLAQVAGDGGDYERARQRYGEALVVLAPIRDPSGLAACFDGLAALARRGENMQRATQLLAVAATLRESVESALAPADRLRFEEILAEARTVLGDPAFEAAWAGGRVFALDDAIAYALAVEAV
jgi:tetratricopeptide (TPR) repeat protein